MITNARIGDKIMAIKVNDALGDYKMGDIIEVVGDSSFNTYLEDGQIEIEALTTSIYADYNCMLFAPVDTLTGDGWRLGLNGELNIEGDKAISSAQLKENPNEKYGNLGVARPDLETRKVGKNRIELVDKGFPNALWEIARLMTKAQEVKQYKDHDWKNLSSDVFSSAASRHRVKHNMGELYDDEFAEEGFVILHKVNEAFNVLAELQILLTKEKNT